MYNLEELKNGMHCTITWLLGDVGTFLKKKYHFALDDTIDVIQNDGDSLIIHHNNHVYALDASSAHAIKGLTKF